jgi:hypothetical protein
LLLTPTREEAISPLVNQTVGPDRRARPKARLWVRGVLLVFAVGLIAVFVTAVEIKPYDDDGKPLRMGTHTRLGMPPCEFYVMFKKPCPACGLTTSFSLLMHGDIWNSLRANAVGTLMALCAAALIPWSLYISIRGRYLWVRSIERASLWAVGILMVLLLARWGIVLWLG